jgi:hypothetical protein
MSRNLEARELVSAGVADRRSDYFFSGAAAF